MEEEYGKEEMRERSHLRGDPPEMGREEGHGGRRPTWLLPEEGGWKRIIFGYAGQAGPACRSGISAPRNGTNHFHYWSRLRKEFSFPKALLFTGHLL